MNKLPNRQSIRIPGFDYADSGSYFITICTNDSENYFGKIQNHKIILNHAGCMLYAEWRNLEKQFPQIILDEFIVMPNHIHGIIEIQNDRVGTMPSIRQFSIVGREHSVRPFCRQRRNLISCSLSEGDHKDTPLRVETSRHSGTKQDTLGRIVQAFKSRTSVEYIKNVKKNSWKPFQGKLWQRNYYEHVIRDEEDYEKISEYISYNPMQWDKDENNKELK